MDLNTRLLYAAAIVGLSLSPAQRITAWLARAGKRFNQVCGGLFAAIGAALALR